jgi:betaine-aldehyde dehydrogenase
MKCVQDESFGPIMTIEVFDTEEQAIALGNDTIFGLAGAVWTQDPEKAKRVARQLRHGTIWINDFHPYVAQAEWGGYKQSGIGRELGQAGLAEYLEHKHIWQNLSPARSDWFADSKGN